MIAANLAVPNFLKELGQFAGMHVRTPDEVKRLVQHSAPVGLREEASCFPRDRKNAHLVRP